MVELAARTIGGLCSRTLRFGAGLSLEELVIRHALGIELDSLERERQPAGVMMIPIPRAGVLRAVRGREAALGRPGDRGGDDQRPRRPGAGPAPRGVALPRLHPRAGGFARGRRGGAPGGPPAARVRRRPVRLGGAGRMPRPRTPRSPRRSPAREARHPSCRRAGAPREDRRGRAPHGRRQRRGRGRGARGDRRRRRLLRQAHARAPRRGAAAPLGAGAHGEPRALHVPGARGAPVPCSRTCAGSTRT